MHMGITISWMMALNDHHTKNPYFRMETVTVNCWTSWNIFHTRFSSNLHTEPFNWTLITQWFIWFFPLSFSGSKFNFKTHFFVYTIFKFTANRIFIRKTLNSLCWKEKLSGDDRSNRKFNYHSISVKYWLVFLILSKNMPNSKLKLCLKV